MKKYFKLWLESFEEWTDGNVVGDINVEHEYKEISIREWRSMYPRQGNTVKALRKLREQYPNYKITVVSIIERSMPYWIHMKQLGLVDNLVPIGGNYAKN